MSEIGSNSPVGNVEDIDNFLQLSDRIATAGQPTLAQYPSIAAAGYRVVVNLALPDSPNALSDESQLASSLDLEYIQIPVRWDAPTLANFQEFVRVMALYENELVFIHCAANKRVAAFMYLYRQIVEGVDETIAQQDLAKIWTPNHLWQNFLDATIDSDSVRL
jgi:protein tyrosine phosphatase (PTP) superfamily phosphohydrolase (DUF442 family)